MSTTPLDGEDRPGQERFDLDPEDRRTHDPIRDEVEPEPEPGPDRVDEDDDEGKED